MKNRSAAKSEKSSVNIRWTKRDFLQYLQLRRRLLEGMQRLPDFNPVLDLPLIESAAKAFVSLDTVERIIDKTSSDLSKLNRLVRLVIKWQKLGSNAMEALAVTRAQRLKLARKKQDWSDDGETLEERWARMQKELEGEEAEHSSV